MTIKKGDISLELAYSERGSVYHHSGKHGGKQADMVLEKAGAESFTSRSADSRSESHTKSGLRIFRPRILPSSDTLPPTEPHLLQQGLTS